MNSSRVHLDRFVAQAASTLARSALVLDAGAGDCRYRAHFAHGRYESADFCRVDKAYAPVDYVCELSAIPVADRRYDMVLLTQVLEHLPDPGAVLDELARVLKPGGTLWLSAPLFYQEHERPYDFYRYTQFGLRELLVRSGFEVRDLRWLEGYLGTLSYQLAIASRELPRKPAACGGGPAAICSCILFAALRPAFGALATLLAQLDVRHRYTRGGTQRTTASWPGVPRPAPTVAERASRSDAAPAVPAPAQPASLRPADLQFLDGLRALAALAVACLHAFLFTGAAGSAERDLPLLAPIFLFGKYGVAVFIVLSGFVLSLPVARCTGLQLRDGTLGFMRRRARRILPPYYAALLAFTVLILAVPGLRQPSGTAWDSKIPVTPGAVIAHLALVHNLGFGGAFRIDVVDRRHRMADLPTAGGAADPAVAGSRSQADRRHRARDRARAPRRVRAV